MYLVEGTQDGVSGCVREFYVILPTMLQDDPRRIMYIREVKVYVDDAIINDRQVVPTVFIFFLGQVP